MFHRIAALVCVFACLPVWGAISVVDITTLIRGSNGSNCTIAQPTGGADGDVLLAVISKDDNPASVPATGSWVTVYEVNDTSGDDQSQSVFHRVVSDWSTEDTTYDEYNFTQDSEICVAAIMLLRGVDTSNVIDVAAATDVRLNDDTPSNSSVTTGSANAWAMHILSCDNGPSQAQPVSPVGPTEDVAIVKTSNGGTSLNISHEAHASAGAVSAEEWTGAGATRDCIAAMFGIGAEGAAPAGRRRVTTP